MESTLSKLLFDKTAVVLMAPDDAWARNQGCFFVFCSLLLRRCQNRHTEEKNIGQHLVYCRRLDGHCSARELHFHSYWHLRCLDRDFLRGDWRQLPRFSHHSLD